jgi:hypothetical protein
MCSTIADKLPLQASAKGPDGWFRTDHAYVVYDHPHHAPHDHAVCLSFVDEGAGSRRVAVELSRTEARLLAERLLAAVERADAYEAT